MKPEVYNREQVIFFNKALIKFIKHIYIIK